MLSKQNRGHNLNMEILGYRPTNRKNTSTNSSHSKSHANRPLLYFLLTQTEKSKTLAYSHRYDLLLKQDEKCLFIEWGNTGQAYKLLQFDWLYSSFLPLDCWKRSCTGPLYTIKYESAFSNVHFQSPITDLLSENSLYFASWKLSQYEKIMDFAHLKTFTEHLRYSTFCLIFHSHLLLFLFTLGATM